MLLLPGNSSYYIRTHHTCYRLVDIGANVSVRPGANGQYVRSLEHGPLFGWSWLVDVHEMLGVTLSGSLLSCGTISTFLLAYRWPPQHPAPTCQMLAPASAYYGAAAAGTPTAGAAVPAAGQNAVGSKDRRIVGIRCGNGTIWYNEGISLSHRCAPCGRRDCCFPGLLKLKLEPEALQQYVAAAYPTLDATQQAVEMQLPCWYDNPKSKMSKKCTRSSNMFQLRMKITASSCPIFSIFLGLLKGWCPGKTCRVWCQAALVQYYSQLQAATQAPSVKPLGISWDHRELLHGFKPWAFSIRIFMKKQHHCEGTGQEHAQITITELIELHFNGPNYWHRSNRWTFRSSKNQDTAMAMNRKWVLARRPEGAYDPSLDSWSIGIFWGPTCQTELKMFAFMLYVRDVWWCFL